MVNITEFIPILDKMTFEDALSVLVQSKTTPQASLDTFSGFRFEHLSQAVFLIKYLPVAH